MNMVEKVARAICDEVNDQPYDALPETATYMERKTHVYRPILDRQEGRQIASAAIEAMREPTEKMIEAGVGADYGGTLGNRAVNSFTAMIDAALSE